MAKFDLPPVPHRAEMLDSKGFTTPVWADWFKKVFSRVGGHLGQSDAWENSDGTGGYYKLPNGIIEQWGTTASLASGSTTAITFPTPFLTACRVITLDAVNNSAVATTTTGQPGTGNKTLTGFDLYNRTSVALTFNWRATGK